MVKVKTEKKRPDKRTSAESQQVETDSSDQQGATERRVIRSRYLAVKSLINNERDEMFKPDSDKFKSVLGEVESLHHLVKKPREQVADAEALLDIAKTLATSVKSQSKEGITPADFVSSLLNDFRVNRLGGQDIISWKDIGIAVFNIFKKAPGLCTMLGPMDTEPKQRKAVVHRKRTQLAAKTRPEEVDETTEERKTDTDKNMSTMFDILRKHKRVRLENLVLNRESFAETVENIFALSFLVKDGRVEITLDDHQYHYVLPRNAPSANLVANKEVAYHHFVFRFDFSDWKIMMDAVPAGKELMPCRGNGMNK